jgi:hypothetical protein
VNPSLSASKRNIRPAMLITSPKSRADCQKLHFYLFGHWNFSNQASESWCSECLFGFHELALATSLSLPCLQIKVQPPLMRYVSTVGGPNFKAGGVGWGWAHCLVVPCRTLVSRPRLSNLYWAHPPAPLESADLGKVLLRLRKQERTGRTERGANPD